MGRRPSISDFLTNLEQPMPLGEKLTKLMRNLWRRVVLRQNCAVGITVNRAMGKDGSSSGSDEHVHGHHHH